MNRPNPNLIPRRMRESLERYRDEGCPVGSFLESVLSNQLTQAFQAADDENLEALPHIVAWVYDVMPSTMCGSPQAYAAHLTAMRVKRDTAFIMDRIADVFKPERDEPVIYNRGELAPRDCRTEHDRSL